MMQPDALPLQLMLAMMQSGISPNGFAPWSSPLNGFLPAWMRPKSPLEQSAEQMFNLWQSGNDQWAKASAQWLNPPPHEKQSPLRRSESRPREKSEQAAFTNPFAEFFNPDFLNTLSGEAYNRSAGFLQGIYAYLASDYERPKKEYDVLWERGSARLLDLAPERKDAVAILCVPSLINRSTILDLYPEASFVEYLKSQGYRPLILDWGSPDAHEQDFATADYISGYALHALQTLRENHDGPITLLGYCMGGIFTVAMAQLAPLFVDALILLATPWDFSAPDTPRVFLDRATQAMLRQWIAGMNPVPPVVTQTLFHLIDPWRVQEKFSRYPDLSEAEKMHFLAVEQWVNAGVPLARRVAEECFVEWPQGNILSEHQWKVGRRWIEPASIACPTLAIIPTKDLIVPQGCALPLTAQIPRCDILQPESGHIGMLAGKNAKRIMWAPLHAWLREKF